MRNLALHILSLLMVFCAISFAIGDDSLVLYCPFEEGTGGETEDISGNENTGTLVGEAKWTKDGKYGNAIEFNGGDAYVDLGNGDSLNIIGDQITLEAWIKADTEFSDYEVIVSKYGGGETYAYQMWIATHKGKAATLSVWPSIPTTHVFGTNDIVDDEWHHVCGTYDGSKARIFVDGVLDNEIDAQGNIMLCPDNAMIGRAARWNDRHFKGIIDEVAIYNRALTGAEIKRDMGRVAAVDKSGKLVTTWARLKS